MNVVTKEVWIGAGGSACAGIDCAELKLVGRVEIERVGSDIAHEMGRVEHGRPLRAVEQDETKTGPSDKNGLDGLSMY